MATTARQPQESSGADSDEAPRGGLSVGEVSQRRYMEHSRDPDVRQMIDDARAMWRHLYGHDPVEHRRA
jgi:hypothetical protein